MSTLICDQTFHVQESSRQRLVSSLRAALNAAEQDEDEVSIVYDNLEVTWDFINNEFFVIG